MARIMGIDFGTKRTGIAVTDPFQIIVSGLTTVETSQLERFLIEYLAKEEVEKVVIGQSFHADGKITDHERSIIGLTDFLKKEFPMIHIDRQDEYYTSELAKNIMLESGLPRKKRRKKETVDKISAVLILQQYLGHI